MQISVDISLYPLQEEFIPPISSFIERLAQYEELELVRNAMSTQVFGPYQRVLEIIAAEMQKTHRQTPKASFVIKALAGDVRQRV